MENDYKQEARRQYLKYFRVWFIVAGILAVITIGMLIAAAIENNRPRTNTEAPSERVYDYADVLTSEQEEKLRSYIAEAEKRLKIDIVLLTTNQPMEGAEAMEQYGYRSTNWEQNMQDTADDFWDENKYGYNKGFEGDGALLLSNWYQGQAGEHLSTSGSVEAAFGVGDIDYLLNRVGRYIEENPYKAYVAYVDALIDEMGDSVSGEYISTAIMSAMVIPLIVALIYAFVHLHQKPAKDTTDARTYVAGGRPVMNYRADNLIRKNVTKRRIETNNGGGGGGRSGGGGGGGGHHRSSSGASHGGGSRRR